MRHKIPIAPTFEGFDLDENISLAKLLPYQDGTLFHGKSFQGVRQILNISQKRLTIECILPETRHQNIEQISASPFNPREADIAFQSMLIWVRNYYKAASLPLRCQRGEYFQRVPTGQIFYVTLEVVMSNPTKLVADIAFHDREGKVYSRIFGAEVTISPQLNSLFVTGT